MLTTPCLHISANANPMPNSLQFLNDNTIAYLARNQVMLYDISTSKVTQNLNIRSLTINRANCICCISGSSIIVGYDTGHLIIYKLVDGEWKINQTEKQSDAVMGINFEGEEVATWNVDGEVIFYGWESQKIHEKERVRFALNKMIETVTQKTIKGTKVIFMAGVDQKIHCYTRVANSQKLIYNFALSGHQNSITKLCIVQQEENYLLASASKDGYIRIWKLTQNIEITKYHKNVKKLSNDYFCFLDAVLISHESSVTGLKWVQFGGKLQLASCSIDCTVCLWGEGEESQGDQGGAWGVESRMGQFLGNKNAYFHIEADEKFQYLVVVNYIGSALLWSYSAQDKKFTLQHNFTGHSNQVKDIDWDSSGNFLVSVSKDQTTRILSRNLSQNLKNFHQISRAQIHGYDINSVALVKIGKDDSNIIDLIACGADQKVIRLVEPPASFANYLNCFSKKNLHLFFNSVEQEAKYIVSKPEEVLEYETYAEGGTQVLGLMTKMQRVERQKISSYYDDEQEQIDEQEQLNTVDKKQINKIDYSVPPNDDYLIKHTLWPQMNKLYGHPQQIATLAKNNVKRLLASSCEGKNKKFCTVIIWSTQNWKIKKMIEFHQYTVYGMQFSQCGEYLATVSKDRQLAVWDSNFDNVFAYEAHSRAITCVGFSLNSKSIVTGGRDKTVRVHSLALKKQICQIDLKKQVYSITFCGDENLISVGLIDGTILFLSFDGQKLSELHKIEDKFSPTFSVTKLKYKNGLLGSSSQDHSVRIYEILTE